MKKWNFPSILALVLLLGSLVLLGCFFAADLFTNTATPPGETTQNASGSTATEDSSQTTESSSEDTSLEDPIEDTSSQDPTEDTSSQDPNTEEPPVNEVYTLSATNAFVYQMSSDSYLYEKGNMDTPIAPASVTKLLTAYVGLQHLAPDTVLTVGDELSLVDANSSVAGLKKDYQLTVEMCVQAMMMPSGNDAAHVLAVAVGRKIGGADLSPKAALEVFMHEVNRFAQNAGMTGTHFVTPDGMDHADHYTTARDMLTLAKLCLQDNTILKYAGTYHQSLTITSGQTLSLTNSNLLLDPYSDFYHRAACGLKTGTTSKAGACLLSLFRKDNNYVIVGVFGCPITPADEYRYQDTLHLYNTYS